MAKIRWAFFLLLQAALLAAAADFPQAEISNGLIRARLYLPDPNNGYYRGTRFDWSGVIYSLQYEGHDYFGPWLEKHDPKLHDAIAGPVEEFRTKDSALGYDEANPGETFIKIGVGVLRKGKEERYAFSIPFEIVDPGRWQVRQGDGWIEFTHTLSDSSGYGYLYTKRISLVAGEAEMILDHTLRNTGRRAIATSVYNHNFFTLDRLPSGPGFVVRFGFVPTATRDMRGFAEIRGRELVYLKELAPGETFGTGITGYGQDARDYDIRVENLKAGAGVHITADRPISNFFFWSARTTVCPEPYMEFNIAPGAEASWRIRYEFYKLPTR